MDIDDSDGYLWLSSFELGEHKYRRKEEMKLERSIDGDDLLCRFLADEVQLASL